jgi:hypothetical protein
LRAFVDYLDAEIRSTSVANVIDNLFYAARLIAKLSMSITLVAASAQSSAVSYVEARRSVLWLTDLGVHAFLGDLSGDTGDVDLNDKHAEGHEHSRQKYTEQSIIVPGTQWSAIPYPGSQTTA